MKSLSIALLLLASCCAVFGYTDICDDPMVDAAFTYGDDVYFFKGEEYWVHRPTSKEPEGPLRIEDKWPGAPVYMDAASYFNDLFLFFKGDEVYGYDNYFQLYEGYPMKIVDRFTGIGDGPVTAATKYTYPNKLEAIYLFQGDMYWSPLTNATDSVANGWKLEPGTVVTSAFEYEGYSIVVSSLNYYKYNLATFELFQDSPPTYPRAFGKYWFDCKDRV